MCLSNSLTCRRPRRIQSVLVSGNFRSVDGIPGSGIARSLAWGKDVPRIEAQETMTQPEKNPAVDSQTSTRSPAGVRWWPLVGDRCRRRGPHDGAPLALSADRPPEGGHDVSMLALMAAFGLTLFWLVLFLAPASEFPRMRGLIGIVALLAARLRTLLEIKGTSGDLTPIIGWRFQSDDLAVPESTAAKLARRSGRRRSPAPRTSRSSLAPPAMASCRGRRSRWSRIGRRNPPGRALAKGGRPGLVGLCRGRAASRRHPGAARRTPRPWFATTWPPARCFGPTPTPARYFTTLGGLGPRATPTIDADLVFTQGATGILNCLELRTGEVVWSVDILEDNAAVLPQWGVAGSPLMLDDLVVVHPGGPTHAPIDRRLREGDRRAGLVRRLQPMPTGARPSWRRSAASGRFSCSAPRGLPATTRTAAGSSGSHPWKGGHPHVSMPLALSTATACSFPAATGPAARR